MSEDNVIDFNSRGKVPPGTSPKIVKGNYEFHFHPSGVQDPAGNTVEGEVVSAQGYLKFGPQFIAVVDSDEDVATVLFAVATPMVKYVKKLDDENAIQATLSL